MDSNLTAAQNNTLSEFCQILNTDDVELAKSYLSSNDWSLEAAVQSFTADQEEGEDGLESDTSAPAAPTTGARTLGGDGVPSQAAPSSSSTSSSRPAQPPAQKKKFGSLRDFQGESSGKKGGDGDKDDKDQEYFAGGDKSGLAVQEPGTSNNSRDHVQRLLETARRNGPPAPPEEEDAPQSNFTGAGMTLGGDDTPSQIIEDPNANVARPPAMVQRTLHLWADGFSVDDGPLYRYDDPANSRTLDMINRGSAPLDIMNVETGQAVDVNLEQHRGENYVQPKKKYKAFSGSGQRLGSPVPGASGGGSSAAPSSTMQTSSGALSSATSEQPTSSVDESQPTITLQIRLADGTRMPSRFNTTQTMGDVYDFVNRASPASAGRPYALATTFPTKELIDKNQVLGDMAEFKRGGVVVQKWS